MTLTVPGGKPSIIKHIVCNEYCTHRMTLMVPGEKLSIIKCIVCNEYCTHHMTLTVPGGKLSIIKCKVCKEYCTYNVGEISRSARGKFQSKTNVFHGFTTVQYSWRVY